MESTYLDRLTVPVAATLRDNLDDAPSLKHFLKGAWLGHPLHPVLTDIPIGAWTAGVVLDATAPPDWARDEGYAAATDTVMLVGLLGALGAALTGLTDWSATEGERRRLGFVHGVTNVTATSLFTISLLARHRGRRAAAKRYAAVGYLVALAGAYLGGHLVFRKEVGVSPDGPSELAGRS